MHIRALHEPTSQHGNKLPNKTKRPRSERHAHEEVLPRLVQGPRLEVARMRVERGLDRVRLEPGVRRVLSARLRVEPCAVAHACARVPEQHRAKAEVPRAVALDGRDTRVPERLPGEEQRNLCARRSVGVSARSMAHGARCGVLTLL